jgi:preprotein translocase subunit SecY
MYTGFHVQELPWIGPSLDAILPSFLTQGLGLQVLGGIFGGTSLLILVGVAMDTVQMVESQLIMRHYDGFLKKGRIRGRRG